MTARQQEPAGLGLGNRLMPARFVLFLVLLVAGYFAWAWYDPVAGWKDTVAKAFDGATLVFLVSLWPLLSDSDAKSMREHARDNDAGRVLVLGLTTLLTVVVMAAISGELPNAQKHETLAIAKLVGTLLLTWLFANSVYTLHYAHMFYSPKPKDGGDCAGIDFPGTKEPDYLDFAYFAFTLGMTFQTSDVEISNRLVRRIVLLHCFAAFIFNLGVIAFTINTLSGGSG